MPGNRKPGAIVFDTSEATRKREKRLSELGRHVWAGQSVHTRVETVHASLQCGETTATTPILVNHLLKLALFWRRVEDETIHNIFGQWSERDRWAILAQIRSIDLPMLEGSSNSDVYLQDLFDVSDYAPAHLDMLMNLPFHEVPPVLFGMLSQVESTLTMFFIAPGSAALPRSEIKRCKKILQRGIKKGGIPGSTPDYQVQTTFGMGYHDRAIHLVDCKPGAHLAEVDYSNPGQGQSDGKRLAIDIAFREWRPLFDQAMMHYISDLNMVPLEMLLACCAGTGQMLRHERFCDQRVGNTDIISVFKDLKYEVMLVAPEAGSRSDRILAPDSLFDLPTKRLPWSRKPTPTIPNGARSSTCKLSGITLIFASCIVLGDDRACTKLVSTLASGEIIVKELFETRTGWFIPVPIFVRMATRLVNQILGQAVDISHYLCIIDFIAAEISQHDLDPRSHSHWKAIHLNLFEKFNRIIDIQGDVYGFLCGAAFAAVIKTLHEWLQKEIGRSKLLKFGSEISGAAVITVLQAVPIVGGETVAAAWVPVNTLAQEWTAKRFGAKVDAIVDVMKLVAEQFQEYLTFLDRSAHDPFAMRFQNSAALLWKVMLKRLGAIEGFEPAPPVIDATAGVQVYVDATVDPTSVADTPTQLGVKQTTHFQDCLSRYGIGVKRIR